MKHAAQNKAINANWTGNANFAMRQLHVRFSSAFSTIVSSFGSSGSGSEALVMVSKLADDGDFDDKDIFGDAPNDIPFAPFELVRLRCFRLLMLRNKHTSLLSS